MSQELELKLVIEPSRKSAVLELCRQLAKQQPEDCLSLANAYFDTDDLRLRQFDIGLRIRSQEDQKEQTVKLAGRVIGGLHERPEYNVKIDQKQPDLRLFDEQIWPEDFPLEDVQRELHCIFETDFTRHRWRIPSEQGVIELVFDQGTIHANDKQETICEVELEVQGGSVQQAFRMARQLIQKGAAQVGNLSKAARGYLLADKSVLEPFTQAHFVAVNQQDSIAQGLYRSLEYSLRHWQHNDACFNRHATVRAAAGIADGVQLCKVVLQQLANLDIDVSEQLLRIEEILSHFSWLQQYDALTELTAEDGAYHRALKRYPALYEQLESLQQQVMQLSNTKTFCQTKGYQLALLELGQLLIEQPQVEAMQEPLPAWSTQLLKNDWQQVVDAFNKEDSLSVERYTKLRPSLLHSLRLGYCFGQLFDEEERETFRAPWLDLARGIGEISALQQLRSWIKDHDELSREKLTNWQEVQRESLLLALEYSRKAALKKEPYWLH
ncbi:phosphate-binding protein [Idiomarina tyrosinivorans]|uniref:Phosphate-binding protein n=1 Tax=Idiomarina tyrosinivorans TaxID=1445662 RepID=A0A432ZG19_9GAMM|nr:CYTH domain-containing protein [Idiomarina tyrosinivorans]RUO76925.1 phosphate-binding protein [Idiomarina tyrosinivorans]